jgi:hypothetical protein
MSAIRHAAFAFVLAGCDGLTGPRARDELALLRHFGEDAPIDLR